MVTLSGLTVNFIILRNKVCYLFQLQLAGAAILAIGVWMLVDDTIVDKLELIKVVSEDDMLQTAAIILCAVGGFALIVALLGCCGAIRKSKCLLGIVSRIRQVVPVKMK